MGYYVELIQSDVILTQEKQPSILQTWKDLNHPSNNHQKRGGSWGNGKQTAHWYSSMPPNYDKTVQTCQDVLDLLGFTHTTFPNGDISVQGYSNKMGQEDIFFKSIASSISFGQHMLFKGEDNSYYAWFFDGNAVIDLDSSSKRKIQAAISQLKSIKTTYLKISTKIDKKVPKPPITKDAIKRKIQQKI